MCLFDFDTFEKRLMIKATGCIIMFRGIAKQNVYRNLKATSDFAQ
jgi:hypothetical protein